VLTSCACPSSPVRSGCASPAVPLVPGTQCLATTLCLQARFRAFFLFLLLYTPLLFTPKLLTQQGILGRLMKVLMQAPMRVLMRVRREEEKRHARGAPGGGD
jgi:hypothetical protein